MEKIVAFAKRRGFAYPGSAIYGGFANSYTYGPYGVELKKNIKDLWWKTFVQNREDVVGIDGDIILHPKTWKASGHLENFNDQMVDCKNCRARLRADHIVEEQAKVDCEGMSDKEVTALIKEHDIKCPKCGKKEFTDVRKFNMMFSTQMAKTADADSDDGMAYLRPETAQAIFLEFKNVVDTMRVKLPFGIGQTGKAFRNEITPGNFTFRTREFEQMEVEYFCAEKDWEKIYPELEKASWDFFAKLGVDPKNLRWRKHDDAELSHYSSLTKDIEYKFPWGWGELQGLAYRADYDLKQHAKFSGESLEYLDNATNEKFVPHCIEPSFGCDRTVLTVLLDAYSEDEVNGEKRVVMKFDPRVAPIKVAILPLSRKEPLTKKAREIYDILRKEFRCEYDETQSIGKRYRRQDEIGTPLCVTVDFGTIGEDDGQSKKDCVTVRDRDSLEQVEVPIKDLRNFVATRIKI